MAAKNEAEKYQIEIKVWKCKCVLATKKTAGKRIGLPVSGCESTTQEEQGFRMSNLQKLCSMHFVEQSRGQVVRLNEIAGQDAVRKNR